MNISLTEIKEEFKINSNDIQEIRENLKRILAENHPDKSGGNFPNVETEEKYYKIQSSIEYIDKIKEDYSLIVIDKMNDLVKVITDLVPNQKNNFLEQNLETKINFAISNFRSKLFIPKISLTTITIIVSFFFLFPNQIKENPVLSKRIDLESDLFLYLWLILLIYSGFFWFMSFINEEKAKAKLEQIKIDSNQNNLFEDFIANKNQFTKDELTNYIYSKVSGKKGFHSGILTTQLFTSNVISIDIVQNISEIIINRALNNNVISKVKKNSLRECYEINN